ncbi:hypothetical protein GOP47_0025964, partial [Adiantum capillus-veneris]
LYRYRLGDVVRVIGFFNASPQLAYVCRQNVLLTVYIDKNTEEDLQLAVNEAVEDLKRHDAKECNRKSISKLVRQDSRRGISPLDLKFNEVMKQGCEQAMYEESILRACAIAMDLAFVDPGYEGSRKGIGATFRTARHLSWATRPLSKSGCQGNSTIQDAALRCLQGAQLIFEYKKNVGADSRVEALAKRKVSDEPNTVLHTKQVKNATPGCLQMERKQVIAANTLRSSDANS